jgi:hypothetical protein
MISCWTKLMLASDHMVSVLASSNCCTSGNPRALDACMKKAPYFPPKYVMSHSTASSFSWSHGLPSPTTCSRIISTHFSFHASLVKLTLSLTWGITTTHAFLPLPCNQSTLQLLPKWASNSQNMACSCPAFIYSFAPTKKITPGS